MTTSAPDLVAQIAARYGASVAPGVTINRCPRGASARPFPVWDEKKRQLIVPDWKEYQASMRRASAKAGMQRGRAARASDQEKLEELRQLHASGARVPAMAAALGVTEAYCRSLLKRLGLKMARVDPGPSPDTLARVAEIQRMAGLGWTREAIASALSFATVTHLAYFMRRSMPGVSVTIAPRDGSGSARSWAERRALVQERIRALLAEGADEALIGAELGIVCRRHLRRVIRAAAPDFAFSKADRFPGREERDAKIRRLVETMSIKDVAGLMGLTVGAVAASVRRSRAAGLIPDEITRARAARRHNVRHGALASRDRAVLARVRSMTYADVAAELGLSLSQVKAAVKRMRLGGLLPPSWAERMPMRESSMNGYAPRKVERNARILELHDSGWSVDRIAPETGAPRRSVSELLQREGRTPRYDRAMPKAARLAELPGLVARGMTGQEIAAHWGMELRYVYALASRSKVSLGRNAVVHNAGDVSPRVAARRELVRHLYTGGSTYAEMRELLKVSDATLSGDIKALGLSGTSAWARGRAAAKAARIAEGAK